MRSRWTIIVKCKHYYLKLNTSWDWLYLDFIINLYLPIKPSFTDHWTTEEFFIESYIKARKMNSYKKLLLLKLKKPEQELVIWIYKSTSTQIHGLRYIFVEQILARSKQIFYWRTTSIIYCNMWFVLRLINKWLPWTSSMRQWVAAISWEICKSKTFILRPNEELGIKSHREKE